MSNKAIGEVSARALHGSVLGSPQETIIVRLRVQAVSVEVLQKARSVLAAHLPRWFVEGGERTCEAVLPASGALGVVTLLAELNTSIQREAGIAVGKPLASGCQIYDEGEATLYLPSLRLKASYVSIKWSCLLLNELLSASPSFDVAKAVDGAREQLKPFAEKGVNNAFILQAAFELGIPVFRPLHNLMVLGTGSQSRWLQSLISDETPKLGVQFAQAKHLTSKLLRSAGLPGGIHSLVKTKDQALQAAEALGYPIVVKPADADRGAGVAAGLKDPISVVTAFDIAAKVSPNVLVERFAPGHTHRLTVQDGKVIRVVRRIAGGVVGDDKHSIEELVSLFQQTPQQQRFARRLGYTPLTLDEEALSLLIEHGLTPHSRPAEGEYIRLRRRDNVNAGGTNEELESDDPTMVHPDNLRLAIEATRVLRLDFAGIDLITTDISRSWLEIGATICEVNAQPQMGASNDSLIYWHLLKRLFPDGATIPAELLVVPENPTEQARIKDALLVRQSGWAISLSSGLWIDGKHSTRGFKHSFEAAQALLQRREVTCALCCMTAKDIHQHGLPLPTWDAVKMVAAAAFSPEEAKVLATIKPWLQAAVQAT